MLANSLFARFDSGNITVAELLCLWSMTKGYKIEIGTFIADHLLRASNKKSGILMCGGVITVIAHYFRIDTSTMERIDGWSVVDLPSLISMHVLRVDSRGHLYVTINGVGEFPMPNRALTRPGTLATARNWSMATLEHLAAMQADPPVLPYRGAVIQRLDDDIPFGADTDAGHDDGDHETEQDDAHDKEDERRDDAEPSHAATAHDEPESSRANTRRRRRNTTDEERLAAMERRMGRMETSMGHMRTDISAILQLMQRWGNPPTKPRQSPSPPRS